MPDWVGHHLQFLPIFGVIANPFPLFEKLSPYQSTMNLIEKGKGLGTMQGHNLVK